MIKRFATSTALAVVLLAAPAMAQDTTLTSGSGAEANSGSISGAQSDNNSSQGQQQNNAGIGNSDSLSVSDSTAVSGSSSGATSNGNQQGQSSALTNTNSNQLGQSASQGNQQGVTVNQAWNYAPQRKVTEIRTNAAVPLAASSSFSSDYCGGTASGGASIAPFGVSIGGAGPTFDKSCQSLRRAEKFGMIAANYHNLGQDELALRAMSMMVWSVCTSDSKGTAVDKDTANACMQAMMLGSSASPPLPPAQPAVTPLETQKPNVQPLPDQYKVPRGDLEFQSNPVIQGDHNQTAFAASAPRP